MYPTTSDTAYFRGIEIIVSRSLRGNETLVKVSNAGSLEPRTTNRSEGNTPTRNSQIGEANSPDAKTLRLQCQTAVLRTARLLRPTDLAGPGRSPTFR